MALLELLTQLGEASRCGLWTGAKFPASFFLLLLMAKPEGDRGLLPWHDLGIQQDTAAASRRGECQGKHSETGFLGRGHVLILSSWGWRGRQ